MKTETFVGLGLGACAMVACAGCAFLGNQHFGLVPDGTPDPGSGPRAVVGAVGFIGKLLGIPGLGTGTDIAAAILGATATHGTTAYVMHRRGHAKGRAKAHREMAESAKVPLA